MKKNINQLLKENPIRISDNLDEIDFETIDFFISKCIISCQETFLNYIKDFNSYGYDFNIFVRCDEIYNHWDIAVEEFDQYLSLINKEHFNFVLFSHYCIMKEENKSLLEDFISKYVYLYLKQINVTEIDEVTLESLAGFVFCVDKGLTFSYVEEAVKRELELTPDEKKFIDWM